MIFFQVCRWGRYLLRFVGSFRGRRQQVVVVLALTPNVFYGITHARWGRYPLCCVNYPCLSTPSTLLPPFLIVVIIIASFLSSFLLPHLIIMVVLMVVVEVVVVILLLFRVIPCHPHPFCHPSPCPHHHSHYPSPRCHPLSSLPLPLTCQTVDCCMHCILSFMGDQLIWLPVKFVLLV